MPQVQSQESSFDGTGSLNRVARFPLLRALAWSADQLYASRGYVMLRAGINMNNPPASLSWQPVAKFVPAMRRRFTVMNRLSTRLFRDGFHALAVLPSGGLVAAVPGVGTRGAVYWGEYFDNAARDEVHIYASTDAGATWGVAYTFPKGAIRHVHNIVHDPWGNCLWVLTGDYDDECRILRAACDFSRVEAVLQGRQQARAVAAIPTQDGLYFSSDTPLE